jgi:hypothetical protein
MGIVMSGTTLAAPTRRRSPTRRPTITERCGICDLPDGQHKLSCSRGLRGKVTAPGVSDAKTPPARGAACRTTLTMSVKATAAIVMAGVEEDDRRPVFSSPDWDRFVKDATDNMLPKLSLSGVGLVLVPDSKTDVKSAVQPGFMVTRDKPVLADIEPRVQVPDKLRAVAEAIVIGNPQDPDFQDKFNAAMERMLPRTTTGRDG